MKEENDFAIKKWDDMSFRDKLLYIWDKIDNDSKRKAFWIYILENYLGVEYNV